MKKRAIPAVVLFVAAASIAAAQPCPIFPLDTNVVLGPTRDAVYCPNCALTGDTGLVVWNEYDILGTRILGSGAFLDTLPIDVSGDSLRPSEYTRPGVASDGWDFLVAWSSYYRTCIALVGPDGTVLRREVVQDSVRTVGRGPTVTFDGTNYLVVWAAWPDEGRFAGYFTRISTHGQMLDSAPRRVAPAALFEEYEVTAEHHGDRSLIVWRTWNSGGPGYELYGTLLTDDGTLLDSVGFPIREGISVGFPSVTHNGANFIVGWHEDDGLVKLTRVTDIGVVLDSAGVAVDTTATWSSDLFSYGDTTLLAWARDPGFGGDSLRVVAARFDSDLRMIDPAPVALSHPEDGHSSAQAPGEPTVGLLGGDYFICWCQPFRDGGEVWNRNVVYRRLDRDGTPVDTAAVIISYGPNTHEYCDVATDGENFIAAWCDTRPDTEHYLRRVFARRFDRQGAMLDSAPLPVGGMSALYIALAYGDNVYLACWREADTVRAARLDRQGNVLDTVPLPVGPGGTRPDVACLDSVFLVVWHVSNHVFGARVSSRGALLDTVPIPLTIEGHCGRNPRLATDGSSFLVTKYDKVFRTMNALRVSTAGEVLDTAEIVLGHAEGNVRMQGDVAFGRGVYLVLADDEGPAWRLTPEGQVLDSGIAVPPFDDTYLELVFDGTQFLVVGELYEDTLHWVGGLRISATGRVEDSVPFHLLDTGGHNVSLRYGTGLAVDSAGRIGACLRAYYPAAGAYWAHGAVFPPVIGISDRPAARLPFGFSVRPTLVRRGVSLALRLPAEGRVAVAVFDITGRLVAAPLDRTLPAGDHLVRLDLARIPAGVHFLRVSAAGRTATQRVLVVR